MDLRKRCEELESRIEKLEKNNGNRPSPELIGEAYGKCIFDIKETDSDYLKLFRVNDKEFVLAFCNRQGHITSDNRWDDHLFNKDEPINNVSSYLAVEYNTGVTVIEI